MIHQPTDYNNNGNNDNDDKHVFYSLYGLAAVSWSQQAGAEDREMQVCRH